jgi:hypothetical protein
MPARIVIKRSSVPASADSGSEADLLRQVLRYLKLLGVFHFRANAGGGLRDGRPVKACPEGTPDILMVLQPHGRLIGIELKAKAGRLRPAQTAWAENARKSGADVWVVRTLEELMALLKQEGLG